MTDIRQTGILRQDIIDAGPYGVEVGGKSYTIYGDDLANLIEQIMISVRYLRDQKGLRIMAAAKRDEETLINAALDAITAVADL